jgi:hypothetical protein
MNCPNCKSLLETGELSISATGSIPCAIIEWFSLEQKTKSLFGFNKKKKLNIIDKRNGHFGNAFYCETCKKIFCEFDVK